MTQKLLVGREDQTDEELYALAIELGCAGYWKGVPPIYKELSIQEGWVLPHVIEEIVQ